MRKPLKYLFWAVGIFFLLVLLSLLLTQTSFFREKVKEQLVAQAGRYLNLELEVDQLNGNFFSWIELTHVQLSDKDKQVLRVGSLHLEYSLLPLLKKEIRIESVLIEEPYIHVWQQKDSSWNFASYLIEQPVSADTVSTAFSFILEIPRFSIFGGEIEIGAFSEMIPKKISDLNLQAGMSYSADELSLGLRELNFVTEEPGLQLKELSGKFSMNSKEMLLENFRMRTSGSELEAGSRYQQFENFQALADAAKIDSSEVELFVPRVHLNCSPSVHLKLANENDVLSAWLELNHQSESVSAEIRLHDFSKLFSPSAVVPFSAKLVFDNFELRHWIDVDEHDIKLEGNVLADGNDLLLIGKNTNIKANLTNSMYNGVYFKTFDLKGSWKENTAQADLFFQTDFGRIAASGKVKNPTTKPEYDVVLEAHDLTIEAFLPQMEHTVLNTKISAKGKGFDLKKIAAEANVGLWNSTIYNINLDSLSGNINWHGNRLNIDSLFAQAPGISARGAGTVSIDSLNLHSRLHVLADSLSILDSFVVLPVSFDSLEGDVSLDGPFTKLKAAGSAKVLNTVAYEISLGKTRADFTASLDPDSLRVWTRAEALAIGYQGFHFDSLHVDLNYQSDALALKAGLYLPDTLELEMETNIVLGDNIRIEVPAFEAKTLLSDYFLDDTLFLDMETGNRLAIENLNLLDRNKPDFVLQAGGRVAMSGTNALNLKLRAFDLEQLNRFALAPDSLAGNLDAEFSLGGTARNPELAGKIDLTDPGFGSYTISALNTTFDYKNEKLSAGISFPELGDDFRARLTVPLKAYLDSLQFVYTQPDSFETEIVLNNIDLHQYGQAFVPHDSIKGILNININGRGTFENPQLFGDVKLSQGLYQNKQYGIDFTDINGALVFNGTEVKIDTLLIMQKKGFLSMSGQLDFDSSLVRGNLIATSLQADAKNFYLARNRNYEVLIDASTFVKTGGGKPEYGGKVKVLRSDIFLPAIMQESEPGPGNDVPMLVDALREISDTLVVMDTVAVKVIDPKQMERVFMDRLRGRLTVEIPRNTWIRSDDMRLEISGDVDIVKTGSNFELFGNVSIVRGYYLFYGKKLNVQESEVIFEGGEDFDPILNFRAEYIFRGSDRQKRYLQLLLTGKLSEPTISFKLDGTEITENDGVSVLLFGTTSDQIGYTEQEGMIGAMSSQAVASLITSQLSKTLGTQFNLDVIEITATENWQTAAFVVGKYITNDIFVIYERGFGEVDGDEITPETITVEYELNDKLFLRLQSGSSITSGFDVILKFEEGRFRRKKTSETPKTGH